MIVVPTFHPAFLLRSSDDEKGDARFKHIVAADVARALALRARKPSWNEGLLWARDNGRLRAMFPTIEEVEDFCVRALNAPIVWVDVEATGESPMACTLICVGMGFHDADGEHAICVPFLRQGGVAYWSEADAGRAYGAVAAVMHHAPTGFQNGSYDTIVLWRHGMPVWRWTDDTMQAHHVVDGEMPHGLAFLAATYTEIPYYKDSVKGDEAWIHKDDLTLRLYNLRDVLCTMRVFPALRAQIIEHDLESLYRAELQQVRIMSAATVRGLSVDLERRDDESIDPATGQPRGLGPRLRVERDAALAVLRQIAGKADLNPASVFHLRDLLFDRLGFPIVLRTEKGAPATNKNAMVLLAVQAETADQQAALTALAKWRRTSKLVSTYVEGLPLLADGRVHPTWKLLPVTGRFASAPNAQNWPPIVKRIFRAAPGHKYVSVDLSQAELRAIAYFASDADLLTAYREGLNVHTVNASLLFRVRNPGTDTNPQTEQYLADASVRLVGAAYDTFPEAAKVQWKPVRRLAKNFVFGDNYGAQAETLFDFIRAQRDPTTDLPYFPDLDLGTIEALKLQWETRLHPAIPRWWQRIVALVSKMGYYRSPLSGRIRWFRAGQKRNEILNTPIQTIVADYMIERTNVIAGELAAKAPGSAIVLQVHDSVTIEAPEAEVEIVSTILRDAFSRPFALKTPFGETYPEATFPPDEVTVGDYLDEV